MKKKLLYLICIILFLTAISGSSGYAQFSIDAQLRWRFEFRDGYRSLVPDNAIPSFIVSQRTRLSFNYKTDKLKVRVTPQDVRVWGDEQLSSSTGVYGDYASLDLHEAYVDFRLLKSTYLKVGRQEFTYDHERLLALRNWNQNGLSYDAVLLKTIVDGWNIHLASSWNSLSETTTDNLYLPQRIKSLSFLWINHKFTNNLNFSFLHIASGITKTDSTNTLNFRQTTGIYSDYKNSGINYRANFYYQYGKNKSGNNLSAFLADADVSYKAGKITPGIGFGYISGNKNISSNTDNLFDVLYGSRHRYFGHMDYFRNIFTHTNQGGLFDFYMYLAYKLSKKISIKNIGHYFNLAQTNSLTSDDKNLGYENELELKYKFSDWGSVKGAYIFCLPTNGYKALKGVDAADFQQFAFIEITITPTLFSQK